LLFWAYGHENFCLSTHSVGLEENEENGVGNGIRKKKVDIGKQ
jgi:hypothetical protein